MTSAPVTARSGRVAAIAVSATLLAALLFPASAINENQAPAEPPPLSVDSLANGSLLAYFRDSISANFGLKALAVHLIAPAHLAVGASPTPLVFLAANGEPFLSEDFVGACSNELERYDFGGMYDELVAAQKRAGRELVFAVVPDKGSIDREQLGANAEALLACSDRNRAYVERIPSIITAWDQFEASPDELYLFGDSHWNYTGGSLFAVSVLEHIAPGIVESDDLVRSSVEHSGDLFALMGVEQTETVTAVEAQRDGVQTVAESQVTPLGYTAQRWQSSGGAEFVPGRTLIIHDSTFAYNAGVYAPYFEDLTAVPIQALSDPGAMARLGDYDRVIVQRVQRGLISDLSLITAADWF
jgi:hypothetical protein